MLKSIWQKQTIDRYPKLKSGGHFDVLIIGGGLTGLSAAYFLKQAGKKVCVLERDRLGSGDTAHTSAHLTAVTDLRLGKLAKNFGEENAKLVWQAGRTAIDAIEAVAADEKIDCDFRRVPGFLYASPDQGKREIRSLQQDAELAQRLGIEARFVEAAPYVQRPAIRFANQARFQPLAYLAGLAKAVHGGGSFISENSEVGEIEVGKIAADLLTVKVGKAHFTADYLVIATHVPLMGLASLPSAALFQTKITPYSSYVISATVPSGKLHDALLWDTSDPYHYLRVDHGPKSTQIIFGGKDHKTGQQADTHEPYEQLEHELAEIFPQAKVNRRWSGQVIETNDGLPYIGETADRQFAATGFSGNGMTFGTVAGLMARDQILGDKNPWAELFSVNRKKVRGGAWEYLKENVDYPYFYLKDRIVSAEGDSTRDVKRGEGKILKLDGKRVACSRDEQGRVTTLAAQCTHMGCIVRWNRAEQTWDCPCHGSRFHPSGEVLAGPAEDPLPKVEAPKSAAKPKAMPTPKSKAKAAKPTAAAATDQNEKRRHPRSAARGKDR